MATPLSALEVIVRDHLTETTAKFWSSAELVRLMNLGVKDLWRSINDLRQNHFTTRDITNVTLAVSGSTLTGVPADVVRVHMLEVLDPTGAHGGLRFEPLPYTDLKFQAARAAAAIDPSSGGVIYFDIGGAGGPVAAPTVFVAPPVTAAVSIAMTYVPSLATLTTSDNNPVPGESDNALVAWTVAFARAKERDDRAPDPGWLQIYGNEKQNILVSLAPRQDQEPQVATAFFETLT